MLEKTLTLRTVTTHARHGTLTYRADDVYIGKSLEKYGEYSELEVTLWRAIVKPGDAVVDVGANIGALTAALQTLVGEAGTVYAIEPQPELFALLQNNAPQAECFHCAVGEDVGTTTIPALSEYGFKNYGGGSSGTGSINVSVDTLDRMIDDDVDFIKVDVEGNEAAVLRGAASLIERSRPVIQIEIDRKLDQAKQVLRLLRDLGYCCYDHCPPLFNPDNFLAEEENLWPGMVSKNAVCFPKERMEEYRSVVADFGLHLIQVGPAIRRAKWAGICRFGGVGDNLLAASVCRPLKRAGYMVEVITQAPQHVIFDNNPFIDKLAVKETQIDLPQGNHMAWQDWFRARSGEYEIFANFSHTMEISLALVPAQTQYWWPAPMRRRLCNYNYLEFVHDVVGMPHEFGRMFFSTDDEVEQALERRRELPGGPPSLVIGWVLTGTRVDKIYPSSTYAVCRLICELGAHVVLMGAPAPAPDSQFAEDIRQTVLAQNGSDRNLHTAISPPGTDAWPIRRILSFAQNACDLVVGPDTGPMWAVAMEPMPKIMLLSHASAENITKHWINTVTLQADPEKVKCHPCHCLHDTKDTCLWMQRQAGMTIDKDAPGAPCISSISADHIINTAAGLLRRI